MGTTDKMFKGGVPTLKLVGNITASVPTVGGTIDTTGTATTWPTGVGSHSFVVVIGTEAILVSARTSNQLTVEQRGYDNTTAASHADGDDVAHELDAATILAHEQHVAAAAAAHTAAAIANVAAGNIAATTVQAAINELDGEKAPLSLTVNTQTGDYTLVLADAGQVVEANKASAIAVTIPPNASVAFPIGTTVTVVQVGAGQLTLVAGAGVTLRNPSSLLARAQWSMLTLYKRGTNDWVVAGDMQ